MFNCIDGSSVDMKKIQKALVFVSRKYNKDEIQKIKSFCFATTITNFYCDILFDDSKDEYEAEWSIEIADKKVIHLDVSKYSVERRIQDVFKYSHFIDWPDENAKSALFGMPQLLYDENGEFLDEMSIGNLLMRITNEISDGTDKDSNGLSYDLFMKAMDVCKQIYLENNLDKYKKGIRGNDLIKKPKSDKL